MSHALHFFVLPASFELSTNAETYKRCAQKWLSQQSQIVSTDEQTQISSRLSSILQGEVPTECDVQWFEGLFAIAMGNLERIDLAAFSEMQDFSLVEEVGLLLPSMTTVPPFPVPSCRSHFPKIGFLSNSMLSDFQFEPGGQLSRSNLQSLEEGLQETLMEFGLNESSARRNSKLRRRFPKELIEGLQDEFAFTAESVASEGSSLLLFYF
jgi:hypothetical protein